MAFNLPTSGYLGTSTRKNIEFRDAIDDQRDFIDQGIGGTPGPDLTIASGVITPTAGFHKIDTEDSASLDELTHIDPLDTLPGGVYVFLRLKSGSRKVLIKPEQGGAGEIFLDTTGDLLLSTGYGGILFAKIGIHWRMHGLILPGGNAPHGYVNRTLGASPWTVPDGVHTIRVTLIGGGGGGGGGGDATTNGGDGSAGSQSQITSPFSLTANGGGGGGGGKSSALGGHGGKGGMIANSRYGANGMTAQSGFDTWGAPHSFPQSGGSDVDNRFGISGKGGDGEDGGGSGAGGAPGFVQRRIEQSVLPGNSVVFVLGSGGNAGTHAGPSGADKTPSNGLYGGLFIEW